MKPRSFKVADRAQLLRVAGLFQSMLVTGPMLIEISDYKEPKTRAQEKLLHSIFTDAAESLEVNGQRFKAETWKEWLVREVLGTEDVTLPSGELIQRRRSTTGLSVAEYTNLIERVEQKLAEEFGHLPQEVA